MVKVEGIKKVSKTKHIDVDDQTKETHIDIRKDDIIDTTTDIAVNPDKTSTITKDTNIKEDFDPKKTRIMFMGTGSFAGAILEQIKRHAGIENMCITTQPDKKLGRKKSSIHRSLADNPVREFAKKHNVDLHQPHKLNIDTIKKMQLKKIDILIVASYGKIIPKEMLEIPKLAAINVHASLLPKLRGASPVQNALLAGLKETGVTIMKMDSGIDTGDIIAQEKTNIKEHEKADELLSRLSQIGAELLAQTMPKWMQGKIKAISQDSSKATLCQLIDREDGHIQWTQTTDEIYNRYRALHPWPGIFSYWEETKNQLIRIKLRAIYPFTDELSDEQKQLTPGTVFIGRDQLCIKTFDTAIIIEAVQPECKTVMPVYDFLNGHNTFEGAVLK